MILCCLWGVAGSFIQVFGRYDGVLSQSVGGWGPSSSTECAPPPPPHQSENAASRMVLGSGLALVYEESSAGFVPAFCGLSDTNGHLLQIRIPLPRLATCLVP